MQINRDNEKENMTIVINLYLFKYIKSSLSEIKYIRYICTIFTGL